MSGEEHRMSPLEKKKKNPYQKKKKKQFPMLKGKNFFFPILFPKKLFS